VRDGWYVENVWLSDSSCIKIIMEDTAEIMVRKTIVLTWLFI